MVYTTDDLCLEQLNNFRLFDEIKKVYPEFKMIAFAISNFRNTESLKNSKEFKDWWENHKDWVEIGVHSYDHLSPPDGDRENQEEWITKAYEELKEFLPKDWKYRSPGFQTTSKTIPILKKLGCSYIAYQTSIKNLINNKIEYGIVNSHLYDTNSIQNLYEICKSQHPKR